MPPKRIHCNHSHPACTAIKVLAAERLFVSVFFPAAAENFQRSTRRRKPLVFAALEVVPRSDQW